MPPHPVAKHCIPFLQQSDFLYTPQKHEQTMFRFSFESLFPGTISGTTYCICQGSHKGQRKRMEENLLKGLFIEVWTAFNDVHKG